MKLYSIFLILFLQCNAHDIDDDDRYTDVFEYNIDYKFGIYDKNTNCSNLITNFDSFYYCDCNSNYNTSSCINKYFNSSEFKSIKINNSSICKLNFNNVNNCIECDDFDVKYDINIENYCNSTLITGIVVFIICMVIVLSIILFYIWYKNTKKKRHNYDNLNKPPPYGSL